MQLEIALIVKHLDNQPFHSTTLHSTHFGADTLKAIGIRHV